MNWNCPLCSEEYEGRLCSVCGFESVYFFGELSEDEKKAQRAKIAIARRNWRKLENLREQLAKQTENMKRMWNEIKKLKREVSELKNRKSELAQNNRPDPAPDLLNTSNCTPKYFLRSKPSRSFGPEKFGVNIIRRGPLEFIENDYFLSTIYDTILDRSTCLMWQQ